MFSKNIKCTTIRPTHWRKVLGLSNSSKLNRKEKKEATITYVKEKYKINEDIDDICDAICIGECYIKEEIKWKIIITNFKNYIKTKGIDKRSSK